MRKNFSLLAISATLVVALIAAPVGAQSTGVSGKPANPDPGNKRTQSIFIYELKPGQQKQDAVTVFNNSDEQKNINVLAVDSVRSSGGAFACAQNVDTKKDVGLWTSVDSKPFVLQARQKREVPFTVTPPVNPPSPGEHNGCIIIQEVKDPSLQGGVALSFRTGIRVAVLIPGKVVKNLELRRLDIRERSTSIVAAPIVYNSGNVSLDVDVDLQMKNVLGGVVQKRGGQLPSLQGQEAEWNFDFDKPFWGGVYQMNFGASYNQGGYLGTPTGDKKFLSVQPKWFVSLPDPKAAAIEAAAVLLVIGGIVFALRRRLQRRYANSNWDSYSVEPGDTINSVADRYGISWKKLARYNQLKAPYSLPSGKHIKVPPKNLSKSKKPHKLA